MVICYADPNIGKNHIRPPPQKKTPSARAPPKKENMFFSQKNVQNQMACVFGRTNSVLADKILILFIEYKQNIYKKIPKCVISIKKASLTRNLRSTTRGPLRANQGASRDTTEKRIETSVSRDYNGGHSMQSCADARAW